MGEPEKIPVKDRYGKCEDPKCVARTWVQLVDRKPVWVHNGVRVCNECLRRIQRAEAA